MTSVIIKRGPSPGCTRVQDFHCPVCGLTLKNRGPNYHHRCPGKPVHVENLAYENPPERPVKMTCDVCGRENFDRKGVLGCSYCHGIPEKVEVTPPIPLVTPVFNQGPGTELKKMLSSVGITPKFGCGCNDRMKTMDSWGVKGCEENFDKIVKWIKDSAKDFGLTNAKMIEIGVKSVTTGLAFKVNPFSPFASLVSEAIHRTEAKK